MRLRRKNFGKPTPVGRLLSSKEALSRRCPTCQAAPGWGCVSTLKGMGEFQRKLKGVHDTRRHPTTATEGE